MPSAVASAPRCIEACKRLARRCADCYPPAVHRKLAASLPLALILACNGGGGGTGDGSSSGDETSGTSTAGPVTDPGPMTTTVAPTTTEDPSSSGEGGSSSSGEPVCEDMDGDGFGAGCAGGEDCDDALGTCAVDCSDLDGDAVPECAQAPGTGVLLFTGAAGGGPASDLYVDSLAGLYMGAGLDTLTDNSFPADFANTTGTMLILNPLEELPEKVVLGARGLLLRGGRVVLIMEHCKDGCFGNAPGDNTFLAALGSSMQLSGEGGAPPSTTPLTLAAVPPTTDIATIVAYESGSVTVNAGVALGTMDGGAGDVVIGYERLFNGDLVVAADSSIFGFMLDQGDNASFAVGLAFNLLGG